MSERLGEFLSKRLKEPHKGIDDEAMGVSDRRGYKGGYVTGHLRKKKTMGEIKQRRLHVDKMLKKYRDAA